jgi:hypothetical protein
MPGGGDSRYTAFTHANRKPLSFTAGRYASLRRDGDDAGRAPALGNQDSWLFIVLEDQASLSRLAFPAQTTPASDSPHDAKTAN